LRKVRAISPVIAQIIIVAIAIAISIAVAGWLMGLWGGYTRTEQLQIISTTSTVKLTDSRTFTFTIVVKNLGSVDSKIIAIKIGETPATTFSVINQANSVVSAGSIVSISGSGSATFAPGQQVTITVVTDRGNSFSGVVIVSG